MCARVQVLEERCIENSCNKAKSLSKQTRTHIQKYTHTHIDIYIRTRNTCLWPLIQYDHSKNPQTATLQKTRVPQKYIFVHVSQNTRRCKRRLACIRTMTCRVYCVFAHACRWCAKKRTSWSARCRHRSCTGASRARDSWQSIHEISDCVTC
jgi:hypothetical protein